MVHSMNLEMHKYAMKQWLINWNLWLISDENSAVFLVAQYTIGGNLSTSRALSLRNV